MKIRIERGDITKMETEAVVNAANAVFIGGGGFPGRRIGERANLCDGWDFLSNAILEEMKSNPSKYFENCDPASMKPVTMDDSQ